jgi:hypothetical protein
VVGAPLVTIHKDSMDKVMLHPPKARAAGCLHDTFEIISFIYRMGGAKFMQAFFQAYLRGRVAPQIVAALADLRAVIFYKPFENFFL